MTAVTAPRFTFPISLDVTGRRCVVAGAGPLAREKADALRTAGAQVDELAPDADVRAALDGTFLLIISGEDGTDAASVFAEAERRGVLVNSLDDIPHCHFGFPSLVERGALKVAISTAGRAPALARRVRLDLEDHLPVELGTLVDAYAAARDELLPRRVPFDVWARAWHAALADLDGLLALCEAGRVEEVRDRIHAAVATANLPEPVE